MVCELQYINPTILFRKSNTATHTNHVNGERKKQGDEICLSHTFNSHRHIHTTSDHAEDPEYGFVRPLKKKKMNTVHLSLYPPHEIAHTHTHTQSLTKEHRGAYTGFGNTQRWNVILQWSGSRDGKWKGC